MNRNIYPASWKKHLDYALVLATFCGQIALSQFSGGRHWMNEQPRNSDMYTYDPWPKVCKDTRTVTGEFDQCQFGAMNRHKEHIRKRTTIKASCYDLVYYVDGKFCGHWPTKCDGQHTHTFAAVKLLNHRSGQWIWPDESLGVFYDFWIGANNHNDTLQLAMRVQDASVNDQKIIPTMV